MKTAILLLLLFFPASSLYAEDSSAIKEVEFEFLWDQPDTKLELQMFEAPLSMLKRVGEQGEFLESKNLPIVRPLQNSKLKIEVNHTQALYLVAKNPSKELVRFFVSPHHTHPASASLGFKFKCLCYNHTYEVKPGKLWYRVMSINTSPEQMGKTIKLRHTLVRKK